MGDWVHLVSDWTGLLGERSGACTNALTDTYASWQVFVMATANGGQT